MPVWFLGCSGRREAPCWGGVWVCLSTCECKSMCKSVSAAASRGLLAPHGRKPSLSLSRDAPRNLSGQPVVENPSRGTEGSR